MQFKNKYSFIFFLVLFSLIIIYLPRVWLFIKYNSFFADLTVWETIQSFLMGVRVDFHIFSVFLGVFVILLALPFNFTSFKFFRKTISIFWVINLIAILVINIGDVLYFKFARRHINNELQNVVSNFDMLTNIAFGPYLHYTIISILGFIALLYYSQKVFNSRIENGQHNKKDILYFCIITLIIVLGVRGTITGRKVFGIPDAFVVDKISAANVSLSGSFTIFKSWRSESKEYFDLKTAIQETNAIVKSDFAQFVNKKEHPVLRRVKQSGKNYNIVLIYIEGFAAVHVDSFSEKKLNLTPFFDSLAAKSFRFNHFYANGQRSIFGIGAAFAGYALPVGFPYLGKGLELYRLSYLGKISKQNGYNTISIISAKRSSFRIDSVSKLSGFDEYYGAQDLELVEDVSENFRSSTGAWDYDMFHFLHKRLNKIVLDKKPFLVFAFTSATHAAYAIPGKTFEILKPHAGDSLKGYLNALNYTDDALRRFFEMVEKEPWFKDTIFIVTGDHGAAGSRNPMYDKLIDYPEKYDLAEERYRIPLIVYAPAIFHSKDISTLGSQIDLIPTIMDLANMSGEYASFGNSLFDKSVKERYAYFNAGNNIGIVDKDKKYILHNTSEVIDTNTDEIKLQKKLERKLLSIDQLERFLVKENRWAKE